MEGSVGAALVAAHHTNGLETDLSIARDGAAVLDRGIDHEAMVTLGLHQVASERTKCVDSHACAVPAGCQRDVHSGVAVIRVVLLPCLDDARDLTVDGAGVDGV